MLDGYHESDFVKTDNLDNYCKVSVYTYTFRGATANSDNISCDHKKGITATSVTKSRPNQITITYDASPVFMFHDGNATTCYYSGKTVHIDTNNTASNGIYYAGQGTIVLLF
jgi:hypothetical protein